MSSHLRYEDIRPESKYRFIINDQLRNTKEGFESSLKWIRGKAGEGGCLMDIKETNISEAIHAINVEKGKSPLIEVQVFFLSKSVYLLFHLKTLYIVGFLIPSLGKKYLYDNGFSMDGFDVLKGHNGDYKLPWRGKQGALLGSRIGIGILVKALDHLNSPDVGMDDKAMWGEIFFLHFAEGARFRAVEKQIVSLIKHHAPKPSRFVGRVPDSLTGLVHTAGVTFDERNNIRYENDIRRDIEEKNQVDYNSSGSLPFYYQKLINSHGKLSKVWVTYVMTKGCVKSLHPEIAEQCRVGNLASLQDVLCLVITEEEREFIKHLESHHDSRGLYNTERHNKAVIEVHKLALKNVAFVK